MHLVVALCQATGIDLHANILVDHGLQELADHIFVFGGIETVDDAVGADHVGVRHAIVATRLRTVFEVTEVAIDFHGVFFDLILGQPFDITAALRVQ